MKTLAEKWLAIQLNKAQRDEAFATAVEARVRTLQEARKEVSVKKTPSAAGQ